MSIGRTSANYCVIRFALLAQVFIAIAAIGCSDSSSPVGTAKGAPQSVPANVADVPNEKPTPSLPADAGPPADKYKVAESTTSEAATEKATVVKAAESQSSEPAKEKTDVSDSNPQPVSPSEPTEPKDSPPTDTAAAKEKEPDTKAAKSEEAATTIDRSPNPFSQQVPIPEFDPELQWLNVGKPLTKADLKGKFVLLDFWTYCCINCMHILPELKKLEQAYPKNLVVIGVHSAKFETEKSTKNIEEAILRYEIEHPVINDADHKVWETYGVRSWPTVMMIDPAGCAVWARSGEFEAGDIREVLDLAIPYYRSKNLLDEKPLKFELLANSQADTPLRFPGKIAADEAGGRLFISDSNHNRIVVTNLEGKLDTVIGSGGRGRADGDYGAATFDHPQGVALHGNLLYVADTENHLLRKVDLDKKQVSTIAGLGKQARNSWPGLEGLTRGSKLPDRWIGKPLETAISSPWDVLIHEKDLYIAMAGPHQIWKMPLDESEIGPYAGNGREDIVDGPLLPAEPYSLGYASFAQPSCLGSDGLWLYVADSEGSSIRAVPFDKVKEVRTVIGTAELPYNRLFHFGDQDGDRSQALLQHCIGLTFYGGQIYVTDTYNNKVKTVNPETGAVKTLAGTGKPGNEDSPGQFDEPAGIAAAKGTLFVADTNNHTIRTIDIASGKVRTLTITGLTPPAK